MGAPILYAEYLQMITDRNTEIISTAGPFEFVDPVITLTSFIKYYQNSQSGKTGIRIYPGLTPDNKLIMIVAQAIENGGGDADFRVFDNSLYPDEGSFPKEAGPLEYEPLIQSFKDLMIVGGVNGSSPAFKYARYYTYEDLNELIGQNVPGSIVDPDVATGYFIRLNHGFLNDALAEVALFERGLDQEYDIHSTSGLNGYTSILYIISKEGADMLNSEATYSRNNYERLLLEMAAPCPTRCP